MQAGDRHSHIDRPKGTTGKQTNTSTMCNALGGIPYVRHTLTLYRHYVKNDRRNNRIGISLFPLQYLLGSLFQRVRDSTV